MQLNCRKKSIKKTCCIFQITEKKHIMSDNQKYPYDGMSDREPQRDASTISRKKNFSKKCII